jgi:acetyl-CoA acetyltransferase
MAVRARLRELAAAVAVVGVGNSDYAVDYVAARGGPPATDAYGLAATAFRRALADAGLRRDDIDGLVVGPTLAVERAGEVLGMDVGWAAQADAANAVIQAAMAIRAGLAECVALVHGSDQRSASAQYGGSNPVGAERHLAYAYYAPWGLTSQGALYALMANRYMAETGFRPEHLAGIVIGQRRFAALNPDAVMRKPLTIEDYMASRFICEPLRLYDYCLVNDGGVALIVTTAERARKNKRAVHLAAVARADLNRDATNLRPRLMDFYHTAHRKVAEDLYEVAGFGPEAVDSLQVYDSFSVHIPFALEGFGFAAPGEAAALVESGALMPSGRLPLNTSGGMLSESYMHGWNHQVEAVRQLRGEAGERQVPGARHIQYVADTAGKVASLIYERRA